MLSGEKVLAFLETQGVNLLRGIITLVVGFFAIHWIMKLVQRSDKYVRIEATLKGFLTNLFKLVLYIIVILTAANVIGIPMTSVVTLLASAGVAVSLAMQGALGNLIGGFIAAFIIFCLKIALGQRNINTQLILVIIGIMLILSVVIPAISSALPKKKKAE